MHLKLVDTVGYFTQTSCLITSNFIESPAYFAIRHYSHYLLFATRYTWLLPIPFSSQFPDTRV